MQGGEELVSIVLITSIRQSIHLFPSSFGPTATTPQANEWTSHNILDKSDTFYVNPFTDRYTYSFLGGNT